VWGRLRPFWNILFFVFTFSSTTTVTVLLFYLCLPITCGWPRGGSYSYLTLSFSFEAERNEWGRMIKNLGWDWMGGK
jgi:hypothetical protein